MQGVKDLEDFDALIFFLYFVVKQIDPFYKNLILCAKATQITKKLENPSRHS